MININKMYQPSNEEREILNNIKKQEKILRNSLYGPENDIKYLELIREIPIVNTVNTKLSLKIHQKKVKT